MRYWAVRKPCLLRLRVFPCSSLFCEFRRLSRGDAGYVSVLSCEAPSAAGVGRGFAEWQMWRDNDWGWLLLVCKMLLVVVAIPSLIRLFVLLYLKILLLNRSKPIANRVTSDLIGV